MILPPQISRSLVPRLAEALHAEPSRFVDLAVDGRQLGSLPLYVQKVERPG